MPGANCSIFGCSTSRRNPNVSIFKIPIANNDFNKKWRSELINVVTKDRIVDKNLQQQINANRLYICEKHFAEDQIWHYPSRKQLKEGAIPTLNLPVKSVPKSNNFASRATTAIEKREILLQCQNDQQQTSVSIYKDFADFKRRIISLQLGNDWSVNVTDNLVHITCIVSDFVTPKFEIFVEETLRFSIRVFGCFLTENHELYAQFNRNFNQITLSNFIIEIKRYELCNGVCFPDSKAVGIQKHVIQKPFSFIDYQKDISKPRYCQDDFLRSNQCELLVVNKNPCNYCHTQNQSLNFENNRKEQRIKQPAKLNAPVAFTHPERIKLTLQTQRLKCKELEQNIKEMRESIEQFSEPVDEQLSQDFTTIFRSSNKSDVPPFMKLFWEEQQKYNQATSSKSIRFHPMIIKFCLALAAKSSSAYSDLRYDSKTGSGILVLPSLRTLRDYKNYIRPQRGFNPQIVKDLKSKTAKFSNPERFVIIIFDEMKIQEDLVWDKNSGELIGFVDLGDTSLNHAALKDVKELATHVLVFLIKSVVNPLSFSFATFATTGASSFQIFPLFWKAVNILESIDLKVIAATADGASPNRKFFRMHKGLGGSMEGGAVYSTINLFSKELRYIYFFADVPHLIKTTRNCLANSGSGKGTRYMWNNGSYILWSHITKFYQEDRDSGLKMLPKLTSDHINLTPFSVMRVRLAAQILSFSVGTCLKTFGPPEAAETAKFCLLMDKFFDCLNVRNTVEYKEKGKPDLRPYISVNDERFDWLLEFLQYFAQWKEAIERREGNFSRKSRSSMFISEQTYEGLQTTVHSFRAVSKYLLENGVTYILSERFCQDDLENYFGRQRAIGKRRDNPSLRDVGYNDNTVKSQFSVRPIAGNVQGTCKWNTIETDDLPKKKKK